MGKYLKIADQVAERERASVASVASVATVGITDAERAAVAYCEMVAREREAGRVPTSYTSVTTCAGCGLVYIFNGAPSHVDACPWCHNRVRGLPIPRPPQK